ncbi:MAG: VWA domain-containing protein [Actinobacteria bacterium]|nr:VWA domain-containing protein [Actinomycetota bacterium]
MRVRPVAGACALVLVLLLGGGLVSPSTASAQDDGSDGSSGESADGLLALAGCLQGNPHLAVSLVFDESRSLRSSDPDALRVDAAVNALDGLAELTSGAAGKPIQVDVEVAAFSDRYRTALPWTTLDDETVPTIRASLLTFKDRTDGIETDIVSALIGARAALSAHSAALESETEQSPCKAVVLFTDGDFVVNARKADEVATAGTSKSYAPGADLRTDEGAAAATEAGREAACAPDGVADGLRGDDIVLLSVMLKPPGAKVDDDFLARITTGDGAAGPCGRLPASGEFLRASDADALISGFDEVAARAAGGSPVAPTDGLVVCDKADCSEGGQTFVLDALTRRFRVLAIGPGGSVGVRVSGPDGSTLVQEAGSFEVAGLTGEASEVAGRGFTVSMDRPDDGEGWDGTWTVSVESVALAGEPATIRVYLFSDVTVSVGTEPLRRGSAAEVSAKLVLPAGRKAGDFLRSAEAKVQIQDPISGARSTVELDGPVAGPFVGTFTTPTDTTANAFDVSAELTVVTADGASITTRSPRSKVLVLRPEGSIQFTPATLSLPTITGDSSTSADLTIVGGKADGCVWLEKSTFDVSGLTVTIDGRDAISEASCLKVTAGQPLTVPVEVTSARRADATVSGVLRLHEATTGQKATVTDLEVSTSLVRGVDEARRVFLAVVLMAAGLLLPLGLLLVINAVSARFQSLDVVRGAAIPVRITNGAVERTDGQPRRLRFNNSDFESLAGTGNVRRFTFGGVEFRARASRNPFGATVALAAPAGGAEKLKGGVGRKVELDTMLAGSWVYLLDPDRTRADRKGASDGTLLAFVTEGPTTDQFTRLQADLDRRLLKVAADLEGAVRAKAPTPAPAADPSPEPASEPPVVDADG